MAEDGNSKIKLPIVQILHEGNLFSEFICGNNVEESIEKLRYSLKSLQAPSPRQAESSYICNVYSDSMLSTILASSSKEYHVIKIYRDGCKKCMVMEPEFFKMSEEYATNGFLWYQARADDIPEYTRSIKKRLIGAVQTAIDRALPHVQFAKVSATICKGHTQLSVLHAGVKN
eukprot:gene21479-27819_t